MTRLTTQRAIAGLAATGALSTAALAAAPVADARTVYACVKKNGTAHIYAKKPKCRKHETRLSWNSQGSAGSNGIGGSSGSNGTEGKEGKAGTNGAVAGFAVGETNSIDLAGVFFAQIPGMSKQLPPGSFIASAYVDLDASTNVGGGEAGVICSLIDTPTGGFGVFNQGLWHSAISAPSSAPFADGQISIHLAFSANSPSTLSLACGEFQSAGTNLKINTSFGVIVAVQTSTNS